MEAEAVVPTGDLKTRIFAAGALAAFLAGLGYAGMEVYRAMTDAFIAPIILSPDNDLVIESKVKLEELQVERDKTQAEADAADADLAAYAIAISRLQALKTIANHSLAWTQTVNAQQTSAGAGDLKTLDEQKAALTKMIEKQQQLTEASHANLSAGVISKDDHQRDLQALRQLKLALLENERARIQSNLQMQEAVLAKQSLSNSHGTPLMPERLLQEDQIVRIELDLIKAESEERAKRAEKKLDDDKLEKINGLERELKARPLFRAIEKSLDVAFVPYTQIEGVKAGAGVFDCVWGLFHCRQVGAISEVVPGEVILPDPWGNQARGQYAILALREHESAKSKTLRVRTR